MKLSVSEEEEWGKKTLSILFFFHLNIILVLLKLIRSCYYLIFLGGMWLGTIAATIGYLWLKPIPTSQKLLNARLTSQTLGKDFLF